MAVGSGASRRGRVAFRDIVPIHEIVDEGVKIVGPAIAVVYVISMLSDIDGQNRHRPLDQRIFGVPRLRNRDLAILDHEPSPAGTELCRSSLHQFLLDLFDRSKVSMSAFSSLPGTLPLPFCLIDFQYSEWL